MEASGMFNTVKVNKNVGNVLDDMGKYEEALVHLQKGLEIKLKLLGSDHPSVAASYSSMGVVLERTGKYEEALEMYSKSLEIDIRVHGDSRCRHLRCGS